MRENIAAEMKTYVSEDKGNVCEELRSPYYEEPIIQFAAANDPLFEEYKRVVGPDHATPQEAFERSFGTESFDGGTVISVVLPISETIRKANRAQKERASREWALLRTFGDEYFVQSARRHLAGYLTGLVTVRLHRWIRIGTASMAPRGDRSPTGRSATLHMLRVSAPSVSMTASSPKKELPSACCPW
ncbi:hypothetical protein [Paenibacillus sp. EKM212P]|uniref:hypothetical protein n=1 Tax=Paenibacillus sp. EKM212P TaxID=1683680 RepID=UPI001EEAB9C8|nr:hypothetical protein [Paenibacillus sp. EKM212P]